MARQFLFDISGIDLNHVVVGPEGIRKINPQRGDMEMLDAIVYIDEKHKRLVGYKDIRADQFWVPGHIPGRPLLPGVLMVEAGAQLSSYYTRKYSNGDGFIGFGSITDCKFRLQVVPGSRLYIIGEQLWDRHGRICSKVQGMVDGNLVFEATVVGVRF